MCERWVGDGDRYVTYWPQVHLTIAALLSHSGWAAQPWVTEGQKPSVYCWYLVPNCHHLPLKMIGPRRLWHLFILLLYVHLLPVGVRICHHHRIQPRPHVKVIFRYLRPDAPVSLFFRLFTRLDRGSVCYSRSSLNYNSVKGNLTLSQILRTRHWIRKTYPLPKSYRYYGEAPVLRIWKVWRVHHCFLYQVKSDKE